MKKILLFLILCSCAKTIKVQVSALKGLNYVEPKACVYKEPTALKYRTTLTKDNLIAFDNDNMEKFLQNFTNQKIAIEKFKLCVKTNEDYYKGILNIILNEKKK